MLVTESPSPLSPPDIRERDLDFEIEGELIYGGVTFALEIFLRSFYPIFFAAELSTFLLGVIVPIVLSISRLELSFV